MSGSPMVRTRAALEVGQPADVVDDLVAVEVVEEAVDGEVAAARVLLGGAEDVVAADEQLGRLARSASSARHRRPARPRAGWRGRSRSR